MICSTCGTDNPPEATSCSSCNSPFSPAPAPEVAGEASVPAKDSQEEPPEEVTPSSEPDLIPFDTPDSATLPEQQLDDTSESTDASHPAASLADDTTPEPAVPVAPKQRQSRLKIALIVLLVVLLLGGGSGIAAFVYSTTRPQPSIHLTSLYALGATPVGAAGTTFHVSGKNFSAHTMVTFLLDGKPAPGSASRQSDSNGAVSSALMVTTAWPIGKHTIALRDAANSATVKGTSVLIVVPGQDKTPGPNGAPTDSASGTITVLIYGTANSSVFSTSIVSLPGTSKPISLSPEKMNLIISGRADGGTVCGEEDDGKVHTTSSTFNGLKETISFTATCSGTYRGGHLTYTETYTSYTTKMNFPPLPGGSENPESTCTLMKPYVATQLEGTFTNSTSISGTFASAAYTMHCVMSNGLFLYNPRTGTLSQAMDQHSAAETGTWTGIAAMRDPGAPTP